MSLEPVVLVAVLTLPEHQEAPQVPVQALGKLVPMVTALATCPPQTLFTLEGVASLFGRSSKSVKRALARGELPPPTCTVFTQPYWTAQALLDHLVPETVWRTANGASQRPLRRA